MNSPVAEVIRMNWGHVARYAHIAWDQLTLYELARTQGDAQQLTDLVQSRYDMPREDAQKQVMSFFERHRNA
jgi:hypothetical protein